MQSNNTFMILPPVIQWLVKKKILRKFFLLALTLLVVWQLGKALTANSTLLLQQVINGLQLGFVYALIALGYTMVYGIVRLINFAHGDVFMIGAFISFYGIARLGLHTWPALLFPNLHPAVVTGVGSVTIVFLSMAICALLAIVIEKVAYKPLRDAPRISALITAIGVSFFLEYFGALPFAFSNNFITFKRPFDVTTWAFSSQGVQQLVKGVAPPPNSILVSNIQLIIITASIVLMLLLQFIVTRTKTGKAMRAVAYDKQTARLMGINADSVITTTFAIGAALAGAAGMLFAIAFPQLVWYMGIIPGMKSFVAAVLGGIGSIPGALVGSLILGQSEVLSAGYISTPMRDAIAFTILIIVLLVRPTGIFGEATTEKA